MNIREQQQLERAIARGVYLGMSKVIGVLLIPVIIYGVFYAIAASGIFK